MFETRYICVVVERCMGDSDDDLACDLEAVLAVKKQVDKYESAGRAFKAAWASFESSAQLLFEHVDSCYRLDLQNPFLPNLESNIQKFNAVCQSKSVPNLMTESLGILQSVHQSVVCGPFEWMGQSVYKAKKGRGIYILVYGKSMFLPLDALECLTCRCSKAQEDLDLEYKTYRAFEVDLQLLVLLWTQRNHLTQNKKQAERAYEVLCDVFAANLKLDARLAIGFAPGSKPIDIQFKASNALCRTYDLMKEITPMVQGAMAELKDGIKELMIYLRSRGGASKKERSI